jgi:hypothetical protein
MCLFVCLFLFVAYLFCLLSLVFCVLRGAVAVAVIAQLAVDLAVNK